MSLLKADKAMKRAPHQHPIRCECGSTAIAHVGKFWAWCARCGSISNGAGTPWIHPDPNIVDLTPPCPFLVTSHEEKCEDAAERTIALHKRVRTIMGAELSWEKKYDLVFEEYQKANVTLEWYDPDTTYQEDVEHFADALKGEADALLKVRGSEPE